MVRRANPKYDLLKQFLEYLRETNYTLIENKLFRESVMWVELPPRVGNTSSINIDIKGRTLTDKREDSIIDTFLDELENPPKQKDELLKLFLDYLRDVDYTLVKLNRNKNYSNFGKTPPNRGDNRTIKIILELNVPSEKEERVLINLYLDDVRNP